MIEATLFSTVNVGIGFIVAWLLSYYVIPMFFGVPRAVGKSFWITMVFTVAALVRNFFVYSWFV